ncbi:MAG: glycosyltransferase [Planctomycetota bacterium]|jgi:glycosyltransferase involved in cell wall biosynthesis
MNNPLNILHLCSIKGRGGTGYMASRLCKFTADKGLRVIVGSCKGSKMEERSRENGLELLEGLKLRRGFHPFDLSEDISIIRKCISEKKIDIIHTWHSIEYWTAAAAVLGTDVKLVRTRGLVTPFKNNYVNRVIHQRTALVHATCRRIADNYKNAGFNMDNVKVIHDGVDAQKFSPENKTANIRREMGIPGEALVFVNIGRLETVKGQCFLIQAMEILKKKGLNFHLLIAGDGSLRSKLEIGINGTNLSGFVHFLGVRKDIPEILNASDLYILSSIGSEGSSRATQEAMACGLPCITTDVGMLPDIINNGENGFTVTAENPEAMADKVEEVTKDRENMHKMGENSRKSIESNYSEDVFATRIIEAYKSIAER